MALRVGIVRDDRYLDHRTGHIHPEHPNRLRAVYRMLDADFPRGVIRMTPDPAPLEHLERVHTPVYVEKVLKTADLAFTNLAPDTPASAGSYLAAWLAVGGCLKGLDALAEDRCDALFCLVRPPGHHALPDRAGGFCIFNNLAATARYALKRHGFGRILIVDWDIHHGNGLQTIFYGEKEVLYFSTHDPLLYPHTGKWEETGIGAGEGYTVNIPIGRDVMDSQMLALYRGVLDPMARRFRPDLILVGAGFDAHHEDPVGRSGLTERAYAGLTRILLHCREAAGAPPILLALEGGYNAASLARSIRAVLRVLTGGVGEARPQTGESVQADRLLHKARSIHGRYGVWCGEEPEAKREAI